MDVQVASVMKGDLPVTMTRQELTSRRNGIEIAFAYFSCILQVLERKEVCLMPLKMKSNGEKSIMVLS